MDEPRSGFAPGLVRQRQSPRRAEVGSMLERTRNVIQIIFVEYLAMMILASVVATLMARRGILGCAPDLTLPVRAVPDRRRHPGADRLRLVGDRHPAAAGIAADGLPPADRERRQRQPDRSRPGEAGRYVFPTSHPSYALVELTFLGLFFLPAYIFGLRPAYIGCELQWFYAQAWTFVALGLFFPALRLVRLVCAAAASAAPAMCATRTRRPTSRSRSSCR